MVSTRRLEYDRFESRPKSRNNYSFTLLLVYQMQNINNKKIKNVLALNIKCDFYIIEYCQKL